MKRKTRVSFLRELQRDQRDRIRGGQAGSPSRPELAGDEAILARAEERIRRRLWLRRALPLNLLFLMPGLLFIGTRSRLVLSLFIASYPLIFVVRALLARLLLALIGPEEILVRNEYERLQKEKSAGD